MANKRIKGQYKGLSIWIKGVQYDLSDNLTRKEIALIESAKPNYIESVEKKSKPKPNKATDSSSESGTDGDTAAKPKP